MKSLEQFIEGALWSSRLLLIVPVIFSVLLALGTLLFTSVDALGLLGRMLGYAASGAQEEVRLELVAEIVGVLDGYLLAIIMLIFALGVYELFINKINVAEGSEFAERLLLIRSLDDLKDRLVKVVLVILVVKFFQQVLVSKFEYPLDLLYLALGILFVGGALYLSHKNG
jgi:uncharacterized membrane protein YqhA